MFTVIFSSIGSFFQEIYSSIIKFQTDRGRSSIYTAGFINMASGAAVFLLIAYLRNNFIFNLNSWPTFGPRLILEILQAQFTFLAIAKSDRSTMAFVQNLTIPLLVAADLLLGFRVNLSQWLGLILILFILPAVFSLKVLDRRGIGYSLFIAVNAVFTLSLFKYDIGHFNSVEAEQTIVSLVLAIYFLLAAKFFAKENPLKFLARPAFIWQGLASGGATIFGSFAVSFGNAGIATAASRAASVLAAIISGRIFFQEQKLSLKILAGLILVAGLILLAL